MKTTLLPRSAGRHINGWTITSVIGAAVVLLPILYVLTGLFRSPNENWDKVKQFLIADYVLGSAKLVLFTGFFAAFIGVVLAWLVVGYTFPMRNFYKWALVLPLAVPPYIAAYTYSSMTGYTGVIQATLRNRFDIAVPPGTIEVMSARGAVFVLTLFLFPYVFMMTRVFLERQSASFVENARLLGHKPLSVFVRVVLPLARPAIMAGVMLVVFEVLSDYGVANFFGVQTVSTAIFQTWFGMYDVQSAMKLAAWLMLAVIGLFMFERLLRRSRRYAGAANRSNPLKPQQLKGIAAWGAAAFCTVVFLLAFLAPIAQLAAWSIQHGGTVWRSDFADLTVNTIKGAGIGTAIILLIALLSSRAARMFDSPFMQALTRLLSAGYSVPGAIIAIGVLAVFIALDEQLSPLYAAMGKPEGSLVLSLSLSMLIAGYVIRFMATGYGALEAGYEKMPRAYSEASRTLGRSSLATFFRVELPLLRGSLLSGFVLTFVEIVKELPLTLLLRPFNYDTLSTRAYQYATDERVFDAALPSLLLVLIGLVSVLFILKPERS
ncbi:ABC transporter permease [Paenibacillus contaminans]|uniref:Iron ABC transporter permease n=1 Tax=Paenibacillus contaminans TaxID=450362 RepID=A0A329MDS9_9BACL|nr:iron ABC transporter permease [Paenibacillus contaminans]RAV17742.1 iron ABC transporter permease [Paenibacillus contaminans]